MKIAVWGRGCVRSAQVMRANPDVAVADMHQFVRGNPLYASWLLTGTDIHLPEDPICRCVCA